MMRDKLIDQLTQEADEITCYASTAAEYRPNRTAILLREAARALEAWEELWKRLEWCPGHDSKTEAQRGGPTIGGMGGILG